MCHWGAACKRGGGGGQRWEVNGGLGRVPATRDTLPSPCSKTTQQHNTANPNTNAQPNQRPTKHKQGAEPLAVDDVLHKVFVEVSEAGTEAAAATAVMMMRCSAPMRPEPPLEVRFDRPFVFAVREVATGRAGGGAGGGGGALLFAGVVECPEVVAE